MSNLNLNKYASRAAYNSGTRPAGEDCVSLAGQEVIYDGVNVILKQNQLSRDAVCLVFYDTVEQEKVFVPIETYVASKMDTTRYQIKDYVRFTRSMGRDVVMHKSIVANNQWATNSRCKLYCDTTAAGGFTITIGNWDRADSWTVSWTAGATLDSIKSQLANSSYVWFTKESGEDFIRVSYYCSSSSYNCTLSNNTGGSIVDLSKYCRINGVDQPEVHRVWQGTDVASLFPNSGFLPVTTVQYARNGYNLSWMCGGNLSRFKTYYAANGSNIYVAETTVAAKMTPAGFASLNNSGVEAQQALYDKYNGSWDAYMEAAMVQIDDKHKDGIEYRSYNNGDKQSKFLASVTTMDFDGTWIPAFPAAYAVAQITDSELGGFNLPTMHELAVFMEDNKMAKINAAMAFINGTNIVNYGYYYWAVSQYNSTNAWFYNSSNGILNVGNKCNALSARAMAYLLS